MRLPLELLRMVIDAATDTYSLDELMALRLVNSNFDKDVLAHAFKHARPDSITQELINRRNWASAPASLRGKYLRHRIKRHPQEMNVFAFLFMSAFDRQVANLGIRGSEEARETLLTEWLWIPSHEDDYVYAITHHPEDFNRILDLWIGGITNGKEIQRSGWKEWLEAQLIQEWKLGQICNAIMKDDEETVSDLMPGLQGHTTLTSYGFGTFPLLFATQQGSISMLKVAIRHARAIQKEDLYKCLRAAIARTELQEERFKLPLTKFANPQHPDHAERCVRFVMRKAMKECHTSVINLTLNWVENDADASLRQPLLDSIFNSALSQGDEQVIRRVGPQVNITSGTFGKFSPVQRAMVTPTPKFSVLRYLLDNGADPNARYSGEPNRKPSAMVLAVRRRRLSLVELLLKEGADPRERDGFEPLMYFATQHSLEKEVRSLLLGNGWESEVRSWEANSAAWINREGATRPWSLY